MDIKKRCLQVVNPSLVKMTHQSSTSKVSWVEKKLLTVSGEKCF